MQGFHTPSGVCCSALVALLPARAFAAAHLRKLRIGTKMGIKFLCPNGHKLNVKGFLRGKKAICPKCGTRVIVPDDDQSVSSEQNECRRPKKVLVTFWSPTRSRPGAKQPKGCRPPSRLCPPRCRKIRPSCLGLQPPHRRWRLILSTSAGCCLVCPARDGRTVRSGVGEIMRSWLNEGRVGASSLVWCAGWAEWRPAAATFPKLGASLSASGAAIASAQISGGAGATVREWYVTRGRRRVAHWTGGAQRRDQLAAERCGIWHLGRRTAVDRSTTKATARNDISVLASAVLVIVSIILVIIVVLVFRGQNQDEPEAKEVHPPRKFRWCRRRGSE